MDIIPKDTNTLIAIGIIIVVAIILIRFIAQIFFRFIGVLLLLGVAAYFLFFWNGGLLDVGNKDFILYELEEKYCREDNPVKCDCIIKPIKSDIESRYSSTQIAEFKKDKLKSFKVLYESVNRKKSEIKKCLEDKNALNIWDDFTKEIIGFDKDGELKKFYDFFTK